MIKGTEKGKIWILLAAYTDPTKMADQIWKEAAAATGDTYAAKEETIDLYYDGEYRGTYMLSEKILPIWKKHIQMRIQLVTETVKIW